MSPRQGSAIFAVLLASSLAACRHQKSGRSQPQDPVDFGLTERANVAPLAFPRRAPRARVLDPVPAFSGLSFDDPVFLTYPPDGTDRVVVVELSGFIVVFANSENVTSAETFLDLRPGVKTGGEEGLLGLAFDPDYAQNGLFYVYYSADAPRRSVVSRFSVSPGNPNRADRASEMVILEVLQPYSNHNAGMIAFGPDRYLYIALGDGGNGGDPHGHGQNLSTLLGSLLRIDPNSGSPYAIPPDNPFVGVESAREEIWAYGLRNPWRFSFDRETGELWLGDVGEGRREEIDLVRKGENYGWNLFEGAIEFSNPGNLPASNFAAPVLDYDHDQGRAVVGGYVYRGSRLSSLRGAYVYGDDVSGRVWAMVYDGSRVLSNDEVANVTALASFGEDQSGELYALSLAGEIYRFVEVEVDDNDFPTLLSETKLFANTAALEPARGLIEYEVNAPLWSDGARKRRWIALPGSADVEFSEFEPWTFPTRTVLVKHFELDGAGANGSTRRLETRVLVLHDEGWAGYTYRWDDAQTDATLIDEAETATLVVSDDSQPGGSRLQTWSFPSRADCMICHTAAGRALGTRTSQLNRSFMYTARIDNQLRSWNHIGLFSTDIRDPASYTALTDPAVTSESLEHRARSYLDANCSQCHRPGGTAPGAIDLRRNTGSAEMNVIGVQPTGGSLGLNNALRVSAGNKESSVLWERLRRLDETRMPPLASHEVDNLAVELLGEWIDSLR